MNSFRDLQEMAHWLNGQNIDVTSWGTNSTKTLDNLWDEYVRGEVSFQADPPLRIVNVVKIIISREDKVLLEVAQEFSSGKRRFRNQPPSEKMKPGEGLRTAAVRCLNEELGIDPTMINFIESGYEEEMEIRESPSYPGLMTQYTLHTVEARVKGLPDQAFWRLNVAAGEGDSIKRHLWDWYQRP